MIPLLKLNGKIWNRKWKSRLICDIVFSVNQFMCVSIALMYPFKTPRQCLCANSRGCICSQSVTVPYIMCTQFTIQIVHSLFSCIVARYLRYE